MNQKELVIWNKTANTPIKNLPQNNSETDSQAEEKVI